MTIPSMSNRLVALLVLIAFFSLLGGAVYFLFVRNVSALTVTVEGPTVARVSLQKGGADMVAVACQGTCVIEKIPPFDYDLVVKADGFVPYSETVSITKSSRFSKTVAMVRDVRTEDYHKEASEAIGEINDKRAVLAETGAEDAGRQYLGSFSGTVFFIDHSPSFRLVARADGKDTEMFTSASGVADEPSAIYSDADGLLWLEAQGSSTLFDLAGGRKEFPSFPSGVEKIAKIGADQITAVVAGSVYTYRRADGTVEKTPLYSDYALLPDNRVVGLVSRGDDAKAGLLNLPDSDKSRIIVDSGAGKRKTVYETDDTVQYVWTESGSVVLGKDDGSKEVLKNFE
jgi:hypothetical protein